MRPARDINLDLKTGALMAEAMAERAQDWTFSG